MEKKIKIHILHCGSVLLDEAIPFRHKTLIPPPFISLFRNKKIRIPVSAYLIEHPKGLILIDTGWHTDIRTKARKHLGSMHYLIGGKPSLPEGEAITEQLKLFGCQPKDIDHIILSHLHDDHVSGLKLLKDAKSILVSDLEIVETQKYKMNYTHSLWQGMKLTPFQFVESKYGPEKKSYDLFADESIFLVHTPGHTDGMISILIQQHNKFVLLCSDTVYSLKACKEMILPGITTNREKAIASLQWVNTMSKLPNCISVLANHDDERKPGVIEL